MAKAIKLLGNILFGCILIFYCIGFMWFNIPELFFKVVDLIAIGIFSVYILLKAIQDIIKEED